jgi:hypothetical protein
VRIVRRVASQAWLLQTDNANTHEGSLNKILLLFEHTDRKTTYRSWAGQAWHMKWLFRTRLYVAMARFSSKLPMHNQDFLKSQYHNVNYNQRHTSHKQLTICVVQVPRPNLGQVKRIQIQSFSSWNVTIDTYTSLKYCSGWICMSEALRLVVHLLRPLP